MRLILAATAIALAAAPTLAQTAPAGQPGAPIAARVAAGTYAVDPFHTQVTWTLNHMGFSLLTGQFGASEGSLTIDPKKPDAAKVEVTFPIEPVVTAAPFAGHLKSKDFFDAATYPTAKFVSTAVKATGTGSATITGNLTIKGVTKPVTLKANFVGAGVNPMSKKPNIGFRATTTINRSDFGIGAYVPVVGDKVELAINAAFTGQ
jgi:polyisoprenoid-binding protein YceI